MNGISVHELHKKYRSNRKVVANALRGLSMDLPAGSMCSITGPSGCGKTTLLNMIGCMDRPDSGEVLLGKVNVAALDDMTRARMRNRDIGYVLQEFNLIDELSVYENVRLPLVISNDVRWKDMRQRVNSALDMVGIKPLAKRNAGRISGGQRQRVAIARALVMQPGIILADEPTGSLDSRAGHDVMKAFSDVNRAGKTIVIVTHDKSIADCCEVRLSMRDGTISEIQS